ncbi:MAG: hypothetical protein ACRC7V_10970, partial [Lachnospiraceae bacterium]
LAVLVPFIYYKGFVLFEFLFVELLLIFSLRIFEFALLFICQGSFVFLVVVFSGNLLILT